MRRPDHYYASNGAKYYVEKLDSAYANVLRYVIRDERSRRVGNVERTKDGTFTATREVSLVRGETWKSTGHRTRKAAADALVTQWVPGEEQS